MCLRVERGGFTRQVPKVDDGLVGVCWRAGNLSFENQMNVSQER